METTEQVNFGPDRVTVEGGRVTIDAKHLMPDWEVREFAPMPIYFRDKKYVLRNKTTAQKPFAVRYILEPWPSGTRDGNRSFTYDEETVRQREADIRAGHVEDAGRAGLIFLYPFLGMLWSGSKDKLRRFGFDARSITGVSIFVVFGLILLELVFAKVLIVRSLKAGDLAIGGVLRAFTGIDTLIIGPLVIRMFWLDLLLFGLLIADLLVRYTQHLKDEEPYWGFLEWLAPRRCKKKVETAVIIDLPPVAQPPPPVAEIEESTGPIKMRKS